MEGWPDWLGNTAHTSQDNRCKTWPSMGGLWAEEAYSQKEQDPQEVEEGWQRTAVDCIPSTQASSPGQNEAAALALYGYPDYIHWHRRTPDQPQPTKKFWALIEHMKSDNQGVSPLKKALVIDDAEKAEILNQQFWSAVNTKERFTGKEFATRCPVPHLDTRQPLSVCVKTSASLWLCQ